jgi:hypothetical protein
MLISCVCVFLKREVGDCSPDFAFSLWGPGG